MTCGIDRMMFSLVRRDLEGLRDRLDPGQYMRDRLLHANTTGSNEPDGMFEVRLSTDVREEVTQAALAEEVDIQLKGATEPRHADDLPSRANHIESL